MAAHPVPHCAATGGRACLHAQVGIDSDVGWTPGARIPPGAEPDLYAHLRAVSGHDRWFTSGVSNIFEFEPTAADNPQAVLDIARGAFSMGARSMGARNLALGPGGGELVRISGYLMRRSDMAKVQAGAATRGDGTRLGIAFLVNQPEHLHRRVCQV